MEKIGSSLEILEYFEELMSKKLSENIKTPFRIKRKGITFRSELRMAGQLLREADGDAELLKEALYILFSDNRTSWRIHGSFRQIIPLINKGLSIVRAIRTEKDRAERLRKALSAVTDSRSSLFDG